MKRRDLLKSTVIAGTGAMLTGSLASTAVADTGGQHKCSS